MKNSILRELESVYWSPNSPCSIVTVRWRTLSKIAQKSSRNADLADSRQADILAWSRAIMLIPTAANDPLITD